jgi:hypothetical protein
VQVTRKKTATLIFKLFSTRSGAISPKLIGATNCNSIGVPAYDVNLLILAYLLLSETFYMILAEKGYV